MRFQIFYQERYGKRRHVIKTVTTLTGLCCELDVLARKRIEALARDERGAVVGEVTRTGDGTYGFTWRTEI